MAEFTLRLLAALDRPSWRRRSLIFTAAALVFAAATSPWTLSGLLGELGPEDDRSPTGSDTANDPPTRVPPAADPLRNDGAPDERVEAFTGEAAKHGATGDSNGDERIDYYVRLAREHSGRMLTQKAILCYTEAIRLRPEDPVLYLERADQYRMAELFEDALHDLDRAIELDPDLPDALALKGMVLLSINDLDGAIEVLTRAIQAEETAAALANRGWAYHRQRDDERALADLDRAIDLDGEFGLAYQYRGLVRKGRRTYESCLEDLEAAVRCDPDNPLARAYLALILATVKDARFRDGERALQHARRACELSASPNANCLMALAAAHAELGDLAEAIRADEEAMRVASPAERTNVSRQLGEYRRRLAARGGGGE